MLSFTNIFRLISLSSLSPEIKQPIIKMWYQYLAANDKDNDLLFMNYGFANFGQNVKKLQLKETDEPYRYCIQLYNYVAEGVNLENKDVLEIGCGRGGGALFVAEQFKPRSVMGLDLSEKAISLCSKQFSNKRVSFLQGDAESLPLKDNIVDIVINIESSHCYGHVERFLKETRRVLRSNGYFLLSDFRSKKEISCLKNQLKDSGLKIIKEEAITRNVLLALELDHKRKLKLIEKKAPRLLKNTLKSFSGIKGSRIYNALKSGETEYLNFILQKE